MVTSLANDFGFASVFARQIEAIGRQGDVAIVISTSGASPNAIEGVVAARRLGLVTVGLIGTPDSELHGLVDVPIVTPGRTPARVQELQLIACHRPVRDGRGRPVPAMEDTSGPEQEPGCPGLLRARWMTEMIARICSQSTGTSSS